MKKLLTILFFAAGITNLFGQFGMNRVTYKKFDWFYVQTKHFNIYFTEKGRTAAEFTTKAAEDALADIEDKLDYKINNRITLIVYNSHNDFQETNTTDSYLGQGVGGFTEPFKNRVVFPFEGNYQKYRHVIHHELVHAVMRDMLYGGTIQNIIAKGITLQLPHWFHEGMSEYLASGWETNSDQFIRNAIVNEFLPDISRLSGYYGYRGGQSVFHYIAEKYGEEKVGEILNKIKGIGNLQDGLKASIGLTLEELNERWKKDLKVEYWPDIATRDEPDDFAERLTDNKKIGGFYNTSPVISPMGDKIAFISDREIYLDVYVMDLKNKNDIRKIISSGTTYDFEELNVLYPALTWAPDNNRLALSVKSEGWDVVTIIDTETEESYQLPFKFDGIESLNWSPDGNKIALMGSTPEQSDIYVYEFDTQNLNNITEDIFTDVDPRWGPESKKIYFSSDRGGYISRNLVPKDFSMIDHDYNQLDLYVVDTDTKVITRITDWPYSDEKSALVSPDSREILFTSDKNGINNIYKKRIVFEQGDSVNTILDIDAEPITNSLNEVSMLSQTTDGKKLTFTTLYKEGYNIFQINNPYEIELAMNELEYTPYMASVVFPPEIIDETSIVLSNDETTDRLNNAAIDENVNEENDRANSRIFTGEYEDDETDSTDMDYSNFIFGADELGVDSSNILAQREDIFNEQLDNNGNFLVNKYKVNFTPDLIYANAGWSSLYGLLGTTVLSFSDVLGNHRLVGITSLQIDLKNSDYGLAYYYLANRLNIGIEGFHTARFIYLSNRFNADLYRYRNFGLVLSASYPFGKFDRVDFGLSSLFVSSENLDNFSVPIEKNTYVIPSISFVHDNTMWGYYSPIQGNRYRFTFFGNPGFEDPKQTFYSVTWDYRNYFRFWYDNSFVFRISGGYSGGQNPQRFFLGGTENWINRDFATGGIPIESTQDFAFLSPALPMRGYNYAERIGTKYALVNLELRMPLIRYLLTGPIPLFFQNVMGAAFIDVGAAWDQNNQLQLLETNPLGDIVTKDMLIGTGFGARFYFLFFLLRVDVAWAYNLDRFSDAKWYFSLGTDF